MPFDKESSPDKGSRPLSEGFLHAYDYAIMDHNMEFEDNRPTSDADRRLAEAKKLTLQPVHADIQPEGPLDSEIAARHANGPAIANVSIDTEEATTQLQPTQSILGTTNDVPASTAQPRRLVFGLIGGVLVISGLTYLAFTL